MAKHVRFYWDSCAWIGPLNGEGDKRRALEILYSASARGLYEIWTSTLSMVEVRRVSGEANQSRPWDDATSARIRDLFRQPFVKPIPLAVDVAERAREIFRQTPGLKKWQDAVHLASALRWDCAVLHTYDHDDLIALDAQFACRNSTLLKICYPDETTDGPLFAQGQR